MAGERLRFSTLADVTPSVKSESPANTPEGRLTNQSKTDFG
jgi:hypothetical protein